MSEISTQQSQSQDKEYWKLVVSLIIDGFGILSYAILGFGEAFDIFWAPISAFFCFLLYRGKAGILGGMFTFGEEIMPFTDIIPSLTIIWLIKNEFIKESKSQIESS